MVESEGSGAVRREEASEKSELAGIWGKNVPRRWNSKCKGLLIGRNLAKESNGKGKMVGGEVRGFGFKC